MGTPLFYIGKSGQGQAIKLVNNLLVAAAMEALAEGMLLVDAQGLPRKTVAQVMENVPALSPFQKMKLSHMVKEEYPTLFSVANMEKDLKLALNELPKNKNLPVLVKVQSLYKKAKNKGLAKQDISAILEVLK